MAGSPKSLASQANTDTNNIDIDSQDSDRDIQPQTQIQTEQQQQKPISTIKLQTASPPIPSTHSDGKQQAIGKLIVGKQFSQEQAELVPRRIGARQVDLESANIAGNANVAELIKLAVTSPLSSVNFVLSDNQMYASQSMGKAISQSSQDDNSLANNFPASDATNSLAPSDDCAKKSHKQRQASSANSSSSSLSLFDTHPTKAESEIVTDQQETSRPQQLAVSQVSKIKHESFWSLI